MDGFMSLESLFIEKIKAVGQKTFSLGHRRHPT